MLKSIHVSFLYSLVFMDRKVYNFNKLLNDLLILAFVDAWRNRLNYVIVAQVGLFRSLAQITNLTMSRRLLTQKQQFFVNGFHLKVQKFETKEFEAKAQYLEKIKASKSLLWFIFETETQGTNFLSHVKGNIKRALYFRVTEAIQATYFQETGIYYQGIRHRKEFSLSREGRKRSIFGKYVEMEWACQGLGNRETLTRKMGIRWARNRGMEKSGEAWKEKAWNRKSRNAGIFFQGTEVRFQMWTGRDQGTKQCGEHGTGTCTLVDNSISNMSARHISTRFSPRIFARER